MTQEKRENFMFTNDTIFYKKLWSLMLPMMLQNLMLALVAVADAFMLGGMDQNYMSAVSLATQIQFIQNMLLSAATGGLAILGAQYWGRGNIKTLDDIFCMALRLCGMVLGLTPVIGIPLPFFSYGGSSLWGFTILLFIFLRIDAGRGRRL